eukprot:Sspe_Gene.9563::Locus_3210_Transcript_1_1_Confidence_1.000_Length_3352::g.9563::m.9563
MQGHGEGGQVGGTSPAARDLCVQHEQLLGPSSPFAPHAFLLPQVLLLRLQLLPVRGQFRSQLRLLVKCHLKLRLAGLQLLDRPPPHQGLLLDLLQLGCCGSHPAGLQLHLQHLDPLVELSDKPCARVLVHPRLVDYTLRLVGVPKCGHGLIEVCRVGADGRQQTEARVPPERVGEDPREQRFAVGGQPLLLLLLVVDESVDYHAQSREGLVDVRSLREALPLGPCLCNPLTPREVHEAHLGQPHGACHLPPPLPFRSHLVPREGKLKDGMAATGLFVHSSRPDCSLLHPLPEVLKTPSRGADHHTSEPLDEGPAEGVLAHLHVFVVSTIGLLLPPACVLRSLSGGGEEEEVPHFLVVDLHEG